MVAIDTLPSLGPPYNVLRTMPAARRMELA
jgi:hypothetical protein